MHLHTHDPFRGAQASAPQILPDAEPKAGPLRVVAWVDRYPPWPGAMAGGELALHGMLKPLVQRGHQVAVCTHSHPGGEPIVFDGVTVHPEADAPKLLDDVDVLLSHLLWTGHARAAAVRGQVPFVYLFHNDFTIPHWRLRPGHVTGVVFNTRWLAESIIGKHPLWEPVPAVVVRPPVSLETYRVDGPGFDREFVTLVNPNQAKGGPLFYEIAERRRQLRFLAVEGAYGHQIRPRRGVHSHVAWQPQTADMVGDVYSRTRVLLVPSDYESFGRVAVETAAAGGVVVASDTPGLREALGPAGLFAPARKAADRWLNWIDALGDRDVYETAQRAQHEHAVTLAAESIGEVDALEGLLRAAANAERLPFPVMGHDPFRKRGRGPRRVEVGEAAQRPQEAPEPVPATVGAGRAEKATQVVPEIEAPTQAPSHTQQGAGVDGENVAGDAGHTPDGEGREALTSETVAPGDGPGSHDAGQPSPEPAPDTKEGKAPGEQPDSEVGPSGGPGADPAPTDDRPALAGSVPDNATGDDGIVAWITGAATPAEAYDRAEAAEWVENQRPKAGRKKRKAVIAAIEPILYED